jgi:tetratricopeptide (TPR) repeat protein
MGKALAAAGRALLAAAALLAVGCATPVLEGERRYREGDRRGALEIWRSVAKGDPDYAAAADRAARVQDELIQLRVGYIESARRLESDGRLAESVLDYRLALALRTDDLSTLAHVQQLARQLASRKRSLAAEYQRVLDRGDLEGARQSLARLRALDPFDPEFETEERQLTDALNAQWRRQRALYREQRAGKVEGLVDAGRAAFREERLDAALDLWRQALLIDPENERIQAYIARTERQLENLERLRNTVPGESGS